MLKKGWGKHGAEITLYSIFMVVYQQLYEKTHIDSHQIDTSIGNIEPHFVTFKQKFKKKTCSLWRTKMEEGGKSLKVFFQWSCDEIQSVVKLALVSTRVPDHECVIHLAFVTRLSSKHIQKIMEVNDFPILNYRRGLFPSSISKVHLYFGFVLQQNARQDRKYF